MLNQVYKARERISKYLKPTPLVYSKELSQKTGKDVYLKLETQNPTNSFKVRPAFNGLLTHMEKDA